ncbi:cytosolic Fe S cluster assembly factor [Trichuris trichiura]|uniref:Cytosolic Fe S cluster assembly factor n=1 Tax=Trichuris trichiura TaxID=36087 RepID=A0A077ZN77_TRITR|nr:cytosolic Fe S cluster assembly factor [Trichuris trichiura]
MNNVNCVILVLSGKGGVGKSTIATQLALRLSQDKRVGILDADLCGPSVPKLLGLQGKQVHQSSGGWVPVYTDSSKRLAVMSIGFLLNNEDDAVIWRGPKKNAMIKDFANSVAWEFLDYLIVDAPPGTSDEHISIVEVFSNLRSSSAILVTTPQALRYLLAISMDDVRREITFCSKANIPVLGLIENMSGYVCPHCSECTNIFSSGSGEQLCSYAGIPFLGRLPIDPKLSEAMELGQSYFLLKPDSEVAALLSHISEKLDLM